MLRSSAAVSVLTSTLLLSLLLLMPLDASTTHTASLNCCFSELSDVVAAVAGAAAAGSDAVMLNEDDDDNMTSFDIHLRPTKNVTLEATTWPEEDGEKVVEVPFGSLETDWSRLMLLLQELRQPDSTTEQRQTEEHLLRLMRLVIKAFQNLTIDRDQSQTTPDAFDNFTDIYAIETSTEEEEEAVTATTTLYTNDSLQDDEPLQTSTLTFNSSLHGNKSNMDQVENDEDSSSEYFFNLSFPNDEAKSDDNVNDVTEAKTSSDTTESSLKNLLSRLQRRNNTRPDSEINAPEAEQELVSTSSSSSSSSSNDASSLLNVLNEDWSIDGFSARSKKEENLTQEILSEERNMGETTTTTTTMALAETSTMIGLDSNATTTTMLPDNITSVAGENRTGAVARYEDDWKSPMPETTGSQETTTTTEMTTITSGSSRRASGFTRRLVSSSPLVLLNKEDSDHQRKPRHEDASTTGSSGISGGSSSSSSAANLQKSSSGKWSVLQEQ